MNRFRPRKKSQGEADRSRRPSVDSDTPPLPSFSSRTFRRKKKAEPAPKPELNIAEVLPSSDDFRTSLIMPNLSARFSMLREQDDPTSKLGKANDDSVLFPKRASRLDLFNSKEGLSDIAEVDSIRGASIRGGSVPRPPFASMRTESYNSDGYGTDEGSIMSRSKPGEGNTMFGGRQKIYKIPVGQAGSIKNFGAAEDDEVSTRKNMGGKAVYVSDTMPSAFQIAKERERQKALQEFEDSGGENSTTRPSREHDRSGSPPYARYDKNRETTSSTTSGPSQSRASTAATSIASQKSVYGAHEAINGTNATPASNGSDRPAHKGKKMYGQGLDQHQLEQLSSLQRMNSLTRQRGPPFTKNLSQSRSATNLNDKYNRAGPVYASNGFRAASPSPSPTPPRMQDFDLGLSRDSPTPEQRDSGHGRSPTTSPMMSPSLDPVNADPTLVAALEPNDLGKATASGAFNKPQKQYNEQQYLQRQLQLQEGRNTPSPGPGRAFSPQGLNNDPPAGRSRNNSGGSNFSRTNSTRHAWEHHMEDRVLRSVPEQGQSSPSLRSFRNDTDSPSGVPGERTFFGGMSGSEIGSNPESESEADPNSPIVPPGKFMGFRQPPPPPMSETKPLISDSSFNFELNNDNSADPAEETLSDSRSHLSASTITSNQQRQQHFPAVDGHIQEATHENATLTPGGATHDLSGMVKQHLRNVSGTSSVYPEDSPRRSSRPEARDSIFGHESALNQQHDPHVPRDSYGRYSDQSAPPMPPPLSFAAKSILEQATVLKHQESQKAMRVLGSEGTDKAQRVLGGEAPRSSHESSRPWQEQLRSHHARGGSTETEREREGLAKELEARKRIVMNNLQPFAEGGSRDASPARGMRSDEGSPSRSGRSFGIMRKANSGSPAPNAEEKPSKAMKMLGIDSKGPSKGDMPPPDLFMGREQLPDRALPPNSKASRSRPNDVRQHSDGSPSKTKRGFFGTRSNQSSRPPSPHSSSRSGSSGADRRTHSRKGSKGNASLERGDSERSHPGGSFSSMSRAEITIPPRSRDGLPPPTPPSAGSRGPFEQRIAPPGTPIMINPSNRSIGSPFRNKFPPSSHDLPPHQLGMHPALSNPHFNQAQNSVQTSPRHVPSNRSGSINKQDISEPTFISTTSTFDTVDLPPGASLSNGMDEVYQSSSAPPIPARDSRRRRTQKIFQSFGNRSDKRPESPTVSSPVKMHMPSRDTDRQSDEHASSHHSGDSGSRSATANGRYVPQANRSHDLSGSPEDGLRSDLEQENGMPIAMTNEKHLQYQARRDVPASAVMF